MIAGLEVVRGRITQRRDGAIVRGVVAGDAPDMTRDPILQAGGPELLAALEVAGPRGAGEALVTSGFRLPSPFVIHAFAPAWQGGQAREELMLAQTHRAIFIAALNHRIRSFAMTPLGPGFPSRRAAAIGLSTLFGLLMDHDAMQRVTIVCPTRALFDVYDLALMEMDE